MKIKIIDRIYEILIKNEVEIRDYIPIFTYFNDILNNQINYARITFKMVSPTWENFNEIITNDYYAICHELTEEILKYSPRVIQFYALEKEDPFPTKIINKKNIVIKYSYGGSYMENIYAGNVDMAFLIVDKEA